MSALGNPAKLPVGEGKGPELLPAILGKPPDELLLLDSKGFELPRPGKPPVVVEGWLAKGLEPLPRPGKPPLPEGGLDSVLVGEGKPPLPVEEAGLEALENGLLEEAKGLAGAFPMSVLSSAISGDEEEREPKGLAGGGEEAKPSDGAEGKPVSGEDDGNVGAAPLSKRLAGGGEEVNPSRGAEGKPAVVAS